MKSPAIALLLSLCVPACAFEDIDELDTAPIPGDGERMLPASMTPAENIGKADAFDPRDDYPSAYGFTEPPDFEVVLPGEFEPANELILGWGSGAWDLEQFFVDLARAGAEEAPVTVYVTSSSQASYVQQAFDAGGVDLDSVSFAVVGLDSIWMRDYGPLVVRGAGQNVVMDGRYYWGRWSDDYMPTAMANARGLDVRRPPIDMEGGNLLSDGAGRCVTTQRLVDNNAERAYTRTDVRNILRDYFGCETTVIVPPMLGEGTGHVDMHVHITGPGHAIVGDYPSSEDSVNAARLDESAQLLQNAGFQVTRIGMPYNSGRSVFRSYTNALALNQAVLVPVYDEDDRFESEALAAYAAAYPGRDIVPIDSDDVIYWSGAVHCVTMTVSP